MVKQPVGAVVIGRNEGERLVGCIKSIIDTVECVVYVDSGSTDDSQHMAKALGVEVVSLDLSVPFTAARARNAGFERLVACEHEIEYVQFVDGDCEVTDGWIAKAVDYLQNNPEVGVVCGRRRERYPERSIYNLLCDLEWDTKTGEVMSCGGDSMMCASVFEYAGGFNPSLIAGEEPELCFRIRKNNWKIWRLGEEMTLHDANILEFGQWWTRNVRAGHAYAEGAYLHGIESGQNWVAASARIWLWGGIVPLIILILTAIHPLYGCLLAVYPFQIARIAIRSSAAERSNWIYAVFVMLGKFPELQGQFKFLFTRLFNAQSTLIEYK